ncbi:MAG: hypothetical protein ACI4PG_12800 [Candidatus Ventricola sp.]
MNAADAFEQSRAQLEAQLRRAGTMEEAVAACTMALERTACALMQDEQDEQARQRQQAVLALARRAPELLRAADAKGELVITDAPKPAGRGGVLGLTGLALGGAAALLVLAGYALLGGKPLLAAAQLVGLALLVLGGRGGTAGEAPHVEARAVCRVDAQAMSLRLLQLCQAADVCVSDLSLLAHDAGRVRLSGTADDAMLDLLCALMEAKESGRPELALRSLDQAEQYLHLLGMELVRYTPENAAMFDLLPTLGDARTIRPALLSEGRLVRRGTAACRMERSVGV